MKGRKPCAGWCCYHGPELYALPPCMRMLVMMREERIQPCNFCSIMLKAPSTH